MSSAGISASGSRDQPADADATRAASGAAASIVASPLGDEPEAALARALTLAAEAGQCVVVTQLAGELEARRLAVAGNVLALPASSSRRGR